MRTRASLMLVGFAAAALSGCGRQAAVTIAAAPTGDLAQTLAAGPGEITVQATGVAAGTDTAAADQATRQALRRAVEQAFGAEIEAQLDVAHRRVIRERITSRTEGFVKTYRVLSQSHQGDSTVVKIEAIVKLGAIKNEVATIRRVLEQKRMPRMMVLVGPRSPTGPARAAELAQSAIENAYQRRGFRLVQATSPTVAESIFTSFERNEVQAVAQVGKTQGAEVVLVGTAKLTFENEKEIYGTVAKFYKPEVTLRAVEADTGRILFSDQETGVASARSNALAKTATAVAERGIETIVKGWQHETRNAEIVVVRVSGISFEDSARLRRMMEGLRGVMIVRSRAFASNRGEFEIEYIGEPVALAEALTMIPTLPLKVIDASGQTIQLERK